MFCVTKISLPLLPLSFLKNSLRVIAVAIGLNISLILFFYFCLKALEIRRTIQSIKTLSRCREQNFNFKFYQVFLYLSAKQDILYKIQVLQEKSVERIQIFIPFLLQLRHSCASLQNRKFRYVYYTVVHIIYTTVCVYTCV